MSLIFNEPVNPVELSRLEALTEEEIKVQKAIQRAREYYMGEQITFLTERMKEYLNLSAAAEIQDFHLNLIQTVVMAVLDELTVMGFDTSETVQKGQVKKQSQWAREVWDENGMAIMQYNILEAALRDSESFVIVDFDTVTKKPVFSWHEKYIDIKAGGNGVGVWFVHDEGDYTQKPLYAVKEWTETAIRNKMPYTYRRRNVYYPDRVEKFFKDPDWKRYTTKNAEGRENPWPTPWVDNNGAPLGIPVFCFRNFGNVPEAKEAMRPQDAINKLCLDVLAEADAAFKIYFLSGAHATTDGQPLQTDGSNRLAIAPMTILSTSKIDAKMSAISGGDPTALMNTLKDFILICAQITATPVSYFIVTKQIAGADTLKGQDKPLTKKVEKRKTIFGQTFEEMMGFARHLSVIFGASGLDEDVKFYTIWKQVFDLETIKMMKEVLGIPQEVLWRLYGLSEEQISDAKESEEYRMTQKAIFWKIVTEAAKTPFPIESVLRDLGWTNEQLETFGTQKLAAIKLQQEDSIPTEEL
jgi:hypothetical protein